jgi:hypothetical protein
VAISVSWRSSSVLGRSRVAGALQLELAPERLDQRRERALITCLGRREIDSHLVNDTSSVANGPAVRSAVGRAGLRYQHAHPAAESRGPNRHVHRLSPILDSWGSPSGRSWLHRVEDEARVSVLGERQQRCVEGRARLGVEGR